MSNRWPWDEVPGDPNKPVGCSWFVALVYGFFDMLWCIAADLTELLWWKAGRPWGCVMGLVAVVVGVVIWMVMGALV